MKNYLQNSLRTLFLSLAVFLSLPMLAEQVEIDGINYDLVAKPNQASVIKKSSGEYSGEIVIPDSVEHEGTAYSVTSIGSYAFYGCYGLTSVTIPNSVTSIGEFAFCYCSGLTTVTIGNSVTSIGDGAFSSCSSLTSVTIPNSVTSIGKWAFQNCSGLISVTIPNSVTSIGVKAFYECSGLKHIIIGDSVTSIGYQAFSDCSKLTSVAIGKSVTNIGDYAFGNCFKLKTIYNLSALNFTQGSLDYGWIARYAVYVINIPNGSLEGNFIFKVTDGKNVLYKHFGNETEPILPENYKGETYVIGSDVFKENATIVSLIIPNSVTSIEDGAFSGCFGLTSVTIPNSVTSIGGDAFLASYRLTSVHITDLAAWCNIEFGSLTANPLNWAKHLYINGEDVKDLVIPDSVTNIGEYAFYSFSALTSVTIPNSVTSIEEGAFQNCSGLTSVTIGSGVESIGEYAFYWCSGLTSVTIGNSVRSIGGKVFYGCSELLDVYCHAEKVPSTGIDIFGNSPIQKVTLHVPAASIYNYKATEPWRSFGKIVALTDEETGIENIDANAENSVIYDLNGRRVQNAQKGIYIKNGKKVMVK